MVALAALTAQSALAGGASESAAVLQERAVAVQPLETVTATAATILDVTDESARLHFIGTIPLACTVVYGETPAFGSASIDQDMSGGAIIEHNPVMVGLQPDTLYYYRVQGSAEDGTFYVSDVATFRTAKPAAAQAPGQAAEGGTNLLTAAGASILAVSSNYADQPNSGTWGIERALDGNGRTAWSSAGDGDDAFVEFVLAERAQIERIEFWTRTMSNDTAQIFSFRVLVDGEQMLGPFSLEDASRAYSFDVDVVASRLRFEVVDSNGGNTGAVEIAAYGAPLAAR